MANEETLTNEAPTPSTPPLTPSAPPLPSVSLLLGTSLLRNVDPDKLQDCQVIAKGGAKVNDLHTELNKISEETHFAKVLIVAGSNDVETKTIDDIITDYIALTVVATEKADEIAICSVLPRTDKDFSEKITKINQELQKTCQDCGHTIINMDNTFRLKMEM